MIIVMAVALINTGYLPGISWLGRTGAYAGAANASGVITAEAGAYLRKSASTSSSSVCVLSCNTKVSIASEVFTSGTSTKKEDRWYYISAGDKKGYVRADLVGSVSYPSTAGKATENLNYRKGPATSFSKVGMIDKGSAVDVTLTAYKSGDKQPWYRIRLNGKAYYVTGEFVKLSGDATPAAEPATTTAAAAAATSKSSKSDDKTISTSGISVPRALYTGQGFGLKGKLTSGSKISKVVVGVTDAKGNWVISKTYDVNAKSFDVAKADADIKFGTLKTGNYKYRIDGYLGDKASVLIDKEFKVMKSEVAAKLLANPTNGGSARVVYTFNTKNCTKVMSIKGHGSAKVPQGMAYTGDKYYIVYGMSNAQAVVTYSASGKRLAAKKFSFNMGHPNGITWDPVTELCYIFRGYQYRCYTWNPSNNKFGKVSTPYSSSGIAYDSSTNLLYSSSKSGIRVYSADGKFKQSKVINRCSRGGTNYVQDCGAGSGFIFHGVSGKNKHGTNYLDVYRAADSKYLGTIKVNIDETEGAIVDNDGFVQILCNTKNETDYIWKTPLNVNDLL